MGLWRTNPATIQNKQPLEYDKMKMQKGKDCHYALNLFSSIDQKEEECHDERQIVCSTDPIY